MKFRLHKITFDPTMLGQEVTDGTFSCTRNCCGNFPSVTGFQMRFVHGHRRETALEQVPGPAAPCIDEIGVAAMCFTYRTAEPIRLVRIQDQVDVVWHQAVSPHFYVGLARLLTKEIAVNLLIAIFKENRFSTVATLRHVVREI